MRAALRSGVGLVVVIAALATSTTAFAQFAYSSSIDGRVVDESGGALPGVAVTLSGPALQVAQSATTDGEGRYRFLELPAGRLTRSATSCQGSSRSSETNFD